MIPRLTLFLPLIGVLAAAQPLVPRGAVWKYHDGASSPGPAWNTAGFDDSQWKSGKAPLGYGDPDTLQTQIGYGGNSKKKAVTSYYRHRFNVADPAGAAPLVAGLRRDDGAVLYLNGREFARSNMRKGDVESGTFSKSTVSARGETAWHSLAVPAELLVAGENLVAAEVHQASPTSSDVVFDLSLGTDTATLVRGPYLQQVSPGGIIIRWRTSSPVAGVVRYGSKPDALSESESSGAAGTEHEVRLSGLNAGTTYYYSVGDASDTLAGGTDDYRFTTSPVAGPPQDTRIWVLGDCGTANKNQVAVRDAFHTFAGVRDADLMLLLGDNAYNDGTEEEYQRAIFNMYPKSLRHIPVWSTLGNHETRQQTDFDGDYPYFDIFTLPTKGESGGLASGTEHYYSFDHANIHFVCLDSMTADRSPKGAMATWLKADLAANTATWLIAFWHHPPYTRGSHNSDVEKPLYEMRRTFGPILEGYGVDLVLSGHSHAYERSFLLDGHYGDASTMKDAFKKDGGGGRPADPYVKPLNGKRGHSGAVYAVAGTSGKTSGGPLDHPAMFISLNDLGSLVLDIKGPKLDATFVHPVKGKGPQPFEIRDRFWILKRD